MNDSAYNDTDGLYAVAYRMKTAVDMLDFNWSDSLTVIDMIYSYQETETELVEHTGEGIFTFDWNGELINESDSSSYSNILGLSLIIILFINLMTE